MSLKYHFNMSIVDYLNKSHCKRLLSSLQGKNMRLVNYRAMSFLDGKPNEANRARLSALNYRDLSLL